MPEINNVVELVALKRERERESVGEEALNNKFNYLALQHLIRPSD